MPNRTFPATPVLLRSQDRSLRTISSSWLGIGLMAAGFALVGAFFTLPAENTWGERFVNGLISATLALAVVYVALTAWNWRSYKRSGYTADDWETVAYHGQEGVTFYLRRREGRLADIRNLGYLSAIILGTDGSVNTIADSGNRGPFSGVRDKSLNSGPFANLRPGTFEIRWYGNTRYGTRGRREILRATVTTQAAPE